MKVLNSPDLVRWNARKTYLDTLHNRGAATIPTVWLERADAADIASAMDRLGCDSVVAKRQVGAGGLGHLLRRAWYRCAARPPVSAERVGLRPERAVCSRW